TLNPLSRFSHLFRLTRLFRPRAAMCLQDEAYVEKGALYMVFRILTRTWYADTLAATPAEDHERENALVLKISFWESGQSTASALAGEGSANWASCTPARSQRC